MQDIAEAMDMKAASLYNHISSKQELLNNIIMTIAEEFTKGMGLILSSNSNNIQKLIDIVELHVAISSNNVYGMAALNNDWMHLDDQLEYYLKLRTEYENNFRGIIKKGINNKEIKLENPEVILFSILSTLRSLYLWIPKKEDLNQKELSASLINILIDGIHKKV